MSLFPGVCERHLFCAWSWLPLLLVSTSCRLLHRALLCKPDQYWSEGGFFILRNYSVDTFQVICHVIFFRWSGMTQLHFLRQTCLCPPCLPPPPPTAAQTPRPRPPSSRCWAPPASPPGGRSQTSANFATGLHGSMALARSGWSWINNTNLMNLVISLLKVEEREQYRLCLTSSSASSCVVSWSWS